MFICTDAVSLYSILPVKQTAITVARLVRESPLAVEGVNRDQAVLSLALTIPRASVEELGLGDMVPRWRKAGGRRTAPGIVTKKVRAHLHQEKDSEATSGYTSAIGN